MTTDLGMSEGAGDLAILGDERIVVAAFAADDDPFTMNLVVLRYLADGTPDLAFGAGGSVITPVGGSNTQLARLVVQPDGKVVAATLGEDGFVLVRLDVDGDLDPTFGDGGIATPPPRVPTAAAGRLVRLPGDRLVAWTVL